MKNIIIFFGGLILTLITALGMPVQADAHGTGHRVLTGEHVVALEFYYSDQTPMRYAEVLVFSPKDAEVEHQYARTDQHGKFVFCPDMQGQWIVKTNDGMGHAEQADVTVGPESFSRPTATSHPAPPVAEQRQISTGSKVVTGLSLILNAFFVIYYVKQRDRQTEL
jgi:nickel transport protein